MKKTTMDASGFLLALIFLLIIGSAAAVYFAIRTDPIAEALSGDRIINTLIVIEEKNKPLSSFVLMYYPATKRASLFDIPGELGLIISSLGRVDRIDVLYKSKHKDAYLSEISKLLGVDVPFAISFNLDSLSALVDLLEGIDVFLADPVVQYEPPVLLPVGAVRLDGAKARLFASYQIVDEDESEVIARRQRHLLSLIKRIGERNAYLHLPSVQRVFHRLVSSTMDERTLFRLLDELSGIEVDRVAVQRVGGNLKEVSSQMLLFPYYDGSLIKDIVKQSLASLVRTGEGGTAERVYTVEVLNGTGGAGLARKTADLLQGFGYDTISIANADRIDYEQTEIIDRSGNADAAKLFAEVIRCESIRSDDGKTADISAFDDRADFTIIIGKDFNGRYVIN